MLKFADAVEAHADELVALEAENTGKPLGLTASEELPPMVDQMRFFAGAARMLEGRSAGEYMEGMTSFIRREPIGVIAQVTPWNYPMMMAVWKFAPALAAGNTIVLKPSDTTPVTTVRLAEIASEFFPPGVFNVVCGDRDTGRLLVSHPTPQMVSITGSVRAGMEVATAASADLKRTHLELGGKAPVLVFDDADVEAAAEGIAVGGYFNAGQDCTAATRVLATPGIYDAIVDALAAQAQQTNPGLPDDENAAFGPLNNPTQLERVSGFLSRLPDTATIVVGGHRANGPLSAGWFLEATLVADVRQGDEIATRGGLRPGHHRAEGGRRGGGAALRQRGALRARVVSVDPRPRAGDAHVEGPGLRLRLDQHPHPDRRRDAPRRLQALRPRQGPLALRPRGLHAHQARHEQHRLTRLTFRGPVGGVSGLVLTWTTRRAWRRVRHRRHRAPEWASCGSESRRGRTPAAPAAR